MVTKALLGDPIPKLAPDHFTQAPIPSAVEAIMATMESLAPYWPCLKFGVKLPHETTNLRKQMAFKMAEFIKSTEIDDSNLKEYLPSQFGAYADTFRINTLSDIKMVSAKLDMVSSSSKDKKDEHDILCEALMEKAKIGDQANGDNSDKILEKTPNPEIYIPSQYKSFGQISGICTVSSSPSTKAFLNTTDSKKN